MVWRRTCEVAQPNNWSAMRTQCSIWCKFPWCTFCSKILHPCFRGWPWKLCILIETDFIYKRRNATPTFILAAEGFLPAKAWVFWHWIHAVLHTRYRNVVATQMAEAKENRVIHPPQFVVICCWIPRPSKEDKRCDQQESTTFYFESRYREEKKNTSRQDLLLPKNACPGNWRYEQVYLAVCLVNLSKRSKITHH